MTPTNLCIGDDLPLSGPASGPPTPNTLGTAFLGEIDRNQTSTNSFGGTAQFTSADRIFGHDNHFVVGASVDHGFTKFNANSELGTVDQNLFVTGTGIFINQPDAGLSAVDLHAINTYTGIYATDTFDVTNRLSVTAGGRFNLAHDRSGGPDRDESASQQQQPVSTVQPGDRGDLQSDPEPDRLCRLFGGQPRADAARAWMFRSEPSLHDRQFPGGRSAAQAGGLAHHRSGRARQLRKGRQDRPG